MSVECYCGKEIKTRERQTKCECGREFDYLHDPNGFFIKQKNLLPGDEKPLLKKYDSWRGSSNY
jgi:hypothetical protein